MTISPFQGPGQREPLRNEIQLCLLEYFKNQQGIAISQRACQSFRQQLSVPFEIVGWVQEEDVHRPHIGNVGRISEQGKCIPSNNGETRGYIAVVKVLLHDFAGETITVIEDYVPGAPTQGLDANHT